MVLDKTCWMSTGHHPRFEIRKITRCGKSHRRQKLQWKQERWCFAKQLFDSETTVARVSVPICETDEYYSGSDAIAFVGTAIRREAVEVSYSRLTEREALEMDEGSKEQGGCRMDPGSSNSQSS